MSFANEGKQKILIVDDSQLSIQILDRILQPEFKTFFATSGREALELSLSIVPDLIILDVVMEEMDGYEVCARLKAEPKTQRIPVIFISAMDKEEDEERGLALGAADYLRKPVSPPIVKARIRNHLKLKHYSDFLENLSETASRAKGEFLANISHELRTPLSPIIGMTDLVLATELSEQQRKYVLYIKNASLKLLDIVDDLIEISRLEANSVKLNRQPFSLESVLSTTISDLSEEARDKGIKLTANIEPGTPDRFLGDPKLLCKMLLKIAGNGIKFTDRGDVTVSAAKEGEEGTYSLIRFSISDTGTGIPAEHLALLSQDLTQADGSYTRKFEGLGLGLTMARKIVTLMGGNIKIDSIEGKGTTFHVTLPFDAWGKFS